MRVVLLVGILLSALAVSCGGLPATSDEPTTMGVHEVVALIVVSAVEEGRGGVGADLLSPHDHRCAARAAIRETGPGPAYDVWVGLAGPEVGTAFDRALTDAYDGCVDRDVLVGGVADLLVAQRRFVFACWDGLSCRAALPADDEYGCIAERLVVVQGTKGVVDLLAEGAGGGPLDGLGRALGSVAAQCLPARFDPCGQSGMKSARPCMPAAKIPLPIT